MIGKIVISLFIFATSCWCEEKTFIIKRGDLTPRHLGRIILNEKYKIAFCPIEKVASTQFKQLFQRMIGDPTWWEPPYHKQGVRKLSEFSLERATEILLDQTWIKAIIFRDPPRRLLSSYLHLVKNPNAVKRYKTMLSDRQKNATWTDFWQTVIAPNGIRNIHWEPQSEYCGLKRYWRYFNYVGNYETILEHGDYLTKIAGLHNFTDQGWAMTRLLKHPIPQGSPQAVRDQMLADVMKSAPVDYNRGDCMWCRNHNVHKSDYKKNPISQFITKKVWKGIRQSQFYKPDYELFRNIIAKPFNFSLYDHYPF